MNRRGDLSPVDMAPPANTPSTPPIRGPLAGHEKLISGVVAVSLVMIGASILALPAPDDGRAAPLPVIDVVESALSPRVEDTLIPPPDSIVTAPVAELPPAPRVAASKAAAPATKLPRAVQPVGAAAQPSAPTTKAPGKPPAGTRTRDVQSTTKGAPRTAGRAVATAEAEAPPTPKSRPARVISACEEHYVAQDWASAFDACSTEAARGTRTAQRRLGVLYLDGRGTKRNEQEAVRLFTDAASAGDTDAMFQLADALTRGRGTRKDEAGAVRWYEKAGDGGIAAAQYALGQAYERGRLGLKKDKGQAIIWYQRAANEGFGDAAKKVRDLSK